MTEFNAVTLLRDEKLITNKNLYIFINNAAKKGLNHVLYFLIQKNINIEEGRACPLECAIENGHLHTVQFLKENGIDIMQNAGFGFRIACRNGHLHIVKFFVQHGIKKEKVPHAIFTCLRLNIFNVVEYLLPLFADEFYNSCFQNETLENYIRYLALKKKHQNKAATKIYFWWIPICYDVNRPCGQRMMEKSWERVEKLISNF